MFRSFLKKSVEIVLFVFNGRYFLVGGRRNMIFCLRSVPKLNFPKILIWLILTK